VAQRVSPSRRSSKAAGAERAGTAPAPSSSSWSRQHLLGLRGLSGDELRTILVRARAYDRAMARVGSHTTAPTTTMGADASAPGSALDTRPISNELRGRTVGNLFFEDSTRTRVSFSVAARRLGAQTVDLASVGSSISKGETVGDTAANIAAMGVDALVIRHRSSGACHLVERTLAHLGHDGRVGASQQRVSIINAGDGRHEHPTQGLLDIYTLAERYGRLDSFDLRGLTLAIVGDVGASRVARSDIAGMTTLGARVICVGPPGLVPKALETLGCEVSHDLDSVLTRVDAVNVLRIQFERHESSGAPGAAGAGTNAGGAKGGNVIASVREYAELYAINAQRVARMKRDAIIMHPGPINRGVELTADVADSQRSMVLRQVTHGVVVRMAALSLCLGH
jgi:aspartate carbamoyltransferase catalytic subunit